MTGVLQEEETQEEQTQKKNVTKEVDTGVMLPQAKKCLGLPEAERGKEGSSPRSFRESTALPKPSFQTAQPLELLTE